MAAPRKPNPFATAEDATTALAAAGGLSPLAREFSVAEETVRRWFRDLGADRPARPGMVSADRSSALGKIAALLDKSNIDINEVGRINQVKLTEWQAMSKDEDGNAVVTDLEGTAIVFTPGWEDGPAWPVVQPARPVTIRPTKARPRVEDGWRRAVILPDPQIGFRRDLTTGEMRPFHDESAIDVAMQIVADTQPDLIINLGDVVDLAEFGRFEQEPGFALTTQATIDRAGEFIAAQRATAPAAEIRYLEGNHDRRLTTNIIANAKAAFGLKKASAAPGDWPVLSIPNLLRLDELGVEYVGGYPAGITWINDRLACIHGHRVKSNGSTAASVIDDERVSVIFGHVHRIELQHRTRRVRHGGRTNLAASPGCLCLTDGSVPSTKSAIDPMGRPVAAVENWQQGVATVTYRDGDEPFHVELVPIHDGEALFRGRLFSAVEPLAA